MFEAKNIFRFKAKCLRGLHNTYIFNVYFIFCLMHWEKSVQFMVKYQQLWLPELYRIKYGSKTLR